jgi:hypothetical protein
VRADEERRTTRVIDRVEEEVKNVNNDRNNNKKKKKKIKERRKRNTGERLAFVREDFYVLFFISLTFTSRLFLRRANYTRPALLRLERLDSHSSASKILPQHLSFYGADHCVHITATVH